MLVPGHQTNSVITIIQQLLRSCETLRYLIQICTVIVIRAIFCVLAVELLKYRNSHFFVIVIPVLTFIMGSLS